MNNQHVYIGYMLLEQWFSFQQEDVSQVPVESYGSNHITFAVVKRFLTLLDVFSSELIGGILTIFNRNSKTLRIKNKKTQPCFRHLCNLFTLLTIW